MVLSFTGHRPQKLGGYHSGIYNRLVDLAVAVLRKYRPEKVITGMALGWDQAVAEAAVYLGIPFIAAVPFKGQENAWPEQSQKKYRDLLAKAKRVVIISAGEYSALKMQARNEYMVNHSDVVIALWDGSSGGTGNCVSYARRMGKQLVNVWPSWMKFKAAQI